MTKYSPRTTGTTIIFVVIGVFVVGCLSLAAVNGILRSDIIGWSDNVNQLNSDQSDSKTCTEKHCPEPVIVKHIDNGGVHRRYKRQIDTFPAKLLFQLTSKDKNIKLNLRRNNLKATVPCYTQLGGFEDVIKFEIERKKDNIKFYTDVYQNAAIGVRCQDTDLGENCHYLLSGTLVINGEHHTIRPRSVENSLEHDLTKTDTEKLSFGTDYIIPEKYGNEEIQRLSFPLSKGLVEESPTVTTHYKIELLPVPDFGVYQVWYNLQDSTKTELEKYEGAVASMMEYYAHIINGMNVHYASIRHVTWDIEIVYAGLYVANVSSASNWTEGIKEDRSDIRYWVERLDGLNRFKSWLETATGLPDYDHAMAFTAYDLYKDSSSSNLGVAWLNGLCRKQLNQYFENSLQEDHMTGILAHVVAHELGHNLGAYHDGDSNTCLASNRYVMAPSVGATTSAEGTNVYIFSNCSIDYFQTYINWLDANNINCMKTLSVNHDSTSLDKYNDTVFNGQIYTVDEQCQYNKNASSYLCRGLHSSDPTTVCKYIYCHIPELPGYCSIHMPWDGTVCGDGQWCIAGACCNDTRAKATDSTCILGDSPFCSATITSTPYLCYNTYYSSRECCSICKNYLTGISGCEYGDKQNGCTSQSCTDTQSSDCCQTCSEDTTSSLSTTDSTSSSTSMDETTSSISSSDATSSAMSSDATVMDTSTTMKSATSSMSIVVSTSTDSTDDTNTAASSSDTPNTTIVIAVIGCVVGVSVIASVIIYVRCQKGTKVVPF